MVARFAPISLLFRHIKARRSAGVIGPCSLVKMIQPDGGSSPWKNLLGMIINEEESQLNMMRRRSRRREGSEKKKVDSYAWIFYTFDLFGVNVIDLMYNRY